MEGKKHVLDRALKGGYIKKENALHIDCKEVICLKKRRKNTKKKNLAHLNQNCSSGLYKGPQGKLPGYRYPHF